MQLLKLGAVFTAILVGTQARDLPPSERRQHVQYHDRYQERYQNRYQNRYQRHQNQGNRHGVDVRVRVSNNGRQHHGGSTVQAPPQPDVCCIPDGQYDHGSRASSGYDYDVERQSKLDIHKPSGGYKSGKGPQHHGPAYNSPQDVPRSNAPIPYHLQGRPRLHDFMVAYEVTSYARMPDPEMVKNYIKGGMLDPNIGDTCVVRLSSGFRGSQVRIPSYQENGGKLLTVRGGQEVNYYYYALRVVEMRNWLEYQYRWTPYLKINKQPQTDFEFSKLDGKRGLVALDAGNKSHFGIYHGDRRDDFFSGTKLEYFYYAKQVTFFELPL